MTNALQVRASSPPCHSRAEGDKAKFWGHLLKVTEMELASRFLTSRLTILFWALPCYCLLKLCKTQQFLLSLFKITHQTFIFFFFSFFFFFSSTSLLLPTHLPPPSCTHAQSCKPMDCSPPGFSVHGLFQVRILEWVAFPSPHFLLINIF